MKAIRSLLLLLAGLLGGVGATAYLMTKNAPEVKNNVSETGSLTRSPAHPLTLSSSQEAAPPNAELEQWKQRAQTVQAQLKEVEGSLLTLRDELAAVQGWQARTPSLVRLGQSLALLPAHKAAAADAAIGAMRFPTVSPNCQKLSIINGIGEIFEQRLYNAGIGSYWEVAHLSDDDFQKMLRLTEWQLTAVDLDDLRAQARQLAEKTGTVGTLWEGETPDDFEQIAGIGKRFEHRLYAAGIRTYRALAACTEEDLAAIIGTQVVQPDFKRWIARASELSAQSTMA